MGLMQRVAGWAGMGARKASSGRAVIRDSQAMGPFTAQLAGFEPRAVNPWLYEALREAIGPIDGAINRMVTMDGILRVRGGNEKLVAEIEDWLSNVPVNDLEGGAQAFYAGQGNEAYEQGFSVGEWVTDAKGRDIVALYVADSKGVVFRRGEGARLETWYRAPRQRTGRADGTDQVEAVLRNQHGPGIQALDGHGFTRLDPGRMIYVGIDNEAGKPYGVSKIRSCEFAAQILLKIQNSTGNVWDRFGDPPLSLTYKTKARGLTQADLDTRRDRLAADLAATMEAKRNGNSVDFVQAVAADDEIEIEVIGDSGKIIEIEMPARHMLEQIVSKFGIPSWMLGFHWSTAERLADAQSTIVLQESKTRFEYRRAALTRLVATMLRLRGRTWRPGDWELYQDLPNLQDELRQAQASFLRAQEQLMLSGVRDGGAADANAGLPGNSAEAHGAAGGLKAGTGASVRADGRIEWGDAVAPPGYAKAADSGDDAPPARAGEPWADPDPELPRVEAQLIADLQREWRRFADEVLVALELPTTDTGAKSTRAKAGWIFGGGAITGVLEAVAERAIQRIAGARGALLRAVFGTWLRGVMRGAEELGRDAILGDMVERVRTDLASAGLALVRGIFQRQWRDRVLAILQDGLLDGLSPTEVARRLRAEFGSADYDWRRLATSELAAAHSRGKLDEYAALGQEQFEFWTATDDRVCAICIGHAENGPYLVSAGHPLPMVDTHPLCRCTIVPYDADDPDAPARPVPG